MRKIFSIFFIVYCLLSPAISLAVEESSFFQFPDGARVEFSYTKNNINDPFCVCLQIIVNPDNGTISYEIVLDDTWNTANNELTDDSIVIKDNNQCQQEAKKAEQTACSLIRLGGRELKPKAAEVKTTNILDEFKLQAPTLQVRIPGFENFSLPPTTMDETGRAYFPWLGEYIRAIYNFGLIAISILAVLMIIVSGIKVVMSGLGGEKKEAYKRISQAVIGLCLAWGSYTILYLINPELLNLRSLGVKLIAPIELQTLNEPTDLELTKGMTCFYETFGKSDAEVQKNLKTITLKDKRVQINTAMEESLNKVITVINNSSYKITTLGGQYWRANVNDPSKRSLHSWGIALDINSDQKINENYSKKENRDGTCYKTDNEMIYTKNEAACTQQGGKTWIPCTTNIPLNIIKAFKDSGFIWGGNFKSVCDSMHFEWHGTCGKGSTNNEPQQSNSLFECCVTQSGVAGTKIDKGSYCSGEVFPLPCQ